MFLLYLCVSEDLFLPQPKKKKKGKEKYQKTKKHDFGLVRRNFSEKDHKKKTIFYSLFFFFFAKHCTESSDPSVIGSLNQF